jgi:hypothetical protein
LHLDDRDLLIRRDGGDLSLRRDDRGARQDLRGAVALERLELEVERAVLLGELSDEAEGEPDALERP